MVVVEDEELVVTEDLGWCGVGGVGGIVSVVVVVSVVVAVVVGIDIVDSGGRGL